MHPVLRQLRRVADDPAAPERTDAQLLGRYLADRDEEAFATLVRRYGRLVRSVCRRVLHHDQDVDDAFQVTFLIFASRAASIRQTTAVASWLHGTAFRSAMNARRERARRARGETGCPGHAEDSPVTAAALREVQVIIDDEVSRLPEKYRAPFVLCCLEGKSRAEAARELGWKEGTVSSRVAQAREQLQKRLTRRGVTLSAGLCALELGRAAVAQPLVDGTIKAALAQAALRGGLSTRLRFTTVLLLFVGLLSGVGGLALLAFTAAPPDARRDGASQAPSGPGQKTLTDHLGDPLPPRARLRLGSSRLRHAGSVGPVVFSPDGKTLATGGTDNAIRVWDVATGRQTRLLLGHRGSLVALAFSADGKRLVSGSAHEPERFRSWDLASGKQLWSCQPPGRLVYATAFAPDGRTVALANDAGLVVLLDAANGKERFRLQGEHPTILNLAFAPDGRSLVVCSDAGPVQVWDLATRKEALRSIGGRSAVFSADGKALHISVIRYLPGDGASRGVGEVWDFAFPGGRPLRSHRYDPPGTAVAVVALAPNGKVGAALCWNGELHVWDVASGKRLRTIAGRIVRPSVSDQLVFSPDGKALAFGRSHSDRAVRLWDVATGKALHPAGGHESLIRAVVVSPDGSRIATGGDGTAILWDAATGKPLHTFRAPGNVLSLAFSADGRKLALGGQSEASIHDVPSGKSLARMQAPRRPFAVLAFTPDGKTLVSGHGDSLSEPERQPAVPETLRTWDAATGKPLHSLEAALFDASDSSPGLLVTPDGRAALALHADQTVRRWDLKTGKDRTLLRVCEPQVRLLSSAISVRGTLLAANLGTGPFRVWDLARGGRRLPWDLPDGFGQALAFSPDQRYLASAGMRLDADTVPAERTIRLWELATGKEAFRLALPPGNAVSQIAFRPDSRSLVAAMADTTVLIWDLRHLKTRGAAGKAARSGHR
jgi:RNA polymerase sigma factor (sigma-70 family)